MKNTNKKLNHFNVIRDCGYIQIIEIDGLIVHRFDERGRDLRASLYDLDENDFATFLDDIDLLASFDTLQEAVNYASNL